MNHARNKQPNVIVFLTDQQRWDTSGLHGNPLELTPNFDRMAQRGTHVAQSFTCQPVCAPARSSLQTGLYATNTGVHRNELALAPELTTLAQHFNAAGYRTGYIGKWHLAGKMEPVDAAATRRLSVLARCQFAGVRIRPLRHQPLRQRQPARASARLSRRCHHRRRDPLRRCPSGSAIFPVHLAA